MNAGRHTKRPDRPGDDPNHPTWVALKAASISKGLPTLACTASVMGTGASSWNLPEWTAAMAAMGLGFLWEWQNIIRTELPRLQQDETAWADRQLEGQRTQRELNIGKAANKIAAYFTWLIGAGLHAGFSIWAGIGHASA